MCIAGRQPLGVVTTFCDQQAPPLLGPEIPRDCGERRATQLNKKNLVTMLHSSLSFNGVGSPSTPGVGAPKNPPSTDTLLTTSDSPKKDIPPENSSQIATLRPFGPIPKKRRQIFKPHPTLNHFNSIFGGDNWARFLTLKSDDKISSGNLENKLLREYPTKELGFRLKGPN